MRIMPDILNKVLAVKAQEAATAQALQPLAMMRIKAERAVVARAFAGAIRAGSWRKF